MKYFFPCRLVFFLALFPGCELFSFVDHFEDHTGRAAAVAYTGKTGAVTMPGGAVAIRPGDSFIAITLNNPRDYDLDLELLSEGPPGSGVCTAVQEDADTVLLTIRGAARYDEYRLTLNLTSPDGLRDFKPYSLPAIRCLSFDTDMADLRINHGTTALDPGFDPAITAYRAIVFDAESLSLAAAAADPRAQVLLDGALLEGGAEAARPLQAGDNPFTLKVRAENEVSEKTYYLNVILVLRGDKDITAFSFSEPPAAGLINGTAIGVTVPYGTDRSRLVPGITHTGVSVNPASGIPQDFRAPVRYTVSATDGSTRDYTVTVTESARSYAITIADAAGGRVSADYETALAGTLITLRVRPDAGYTLKDGSLRVNDGEAALAGSGPDYTFTMPEADVRVTAAFAREAGFDIAGPQDRPIRVTVLHSAGREPPTDISYSAGESVTFTVDGPYTQESGTLRWYVNGTARTGAGSSLGINAADHIKRDYPLTVFIEDGGLWYSADSSFRVID
jgi:hypothetical protein